MIQLAKPDIHQDDFNYLHNVLDSKHLVQGKFVAELEQFFEKTTSTKNAIAVSNGTATMHLGLLALGIGPGDEVIVPAFSYIATANVVEIVGAKPVFVDIDINTFNINPGLVELAITKKTKAILVVHEFGLSADIDTLQSICENYNLFLLEDAACALGALYKGKHVGQFGEWASFSLHPRKAITTGEGGVVTTNNNNLSTKLRTLRNHGINAEGDFELAGFNYRLTDLQAALLQGQMKRFNHNIEFKRVLANRYHQEIKSNKITLPVEPDYATHAWQSFHVIVNNELNRAEVIQYLQQNGIASNYGAQCIPEQAYYKKKYNLNSTIEFPNALRAFTKGLVIPNYFGLDQHQIEHIIKTMNNL